MLTIPCYYITLILRQNNTPCSYRASLIGTLSPSKLDKTHCYSIKGLRTKCLIGLKLTSGQDLVKVKSPSVITALYMYSIVRVITLVVMATGSGEDRE